MIEVLDQFQTLVAGFMSFLAGMFAIAGGWMALRGAREQAQAAVRAAQLHIEAQSRKADQRRSHERQALATLIQVQLSAYATDLISLRLQIEDAVAERQKGNAATPFVGRIVSRPNLREYSWRDLALLGPGIAGHLVRIVDTADTLSEAIKDRIAPVFGAGIDAALGSLIAKPVCELVDRSIAEITGLCRTLDKIAPGVLNIANMVAGIKMMPQARQESASLNDLLNAVDAMPSARDSHPSHPRA